jgi:hypothetical protein
MKVFLWFSLEYMLAVEDHRCNYNEKLGNFERGEECILVRAKVVHSIDALFSV